MNTRECADYLGISEPTLKRWRQRNEGPPFLRVGPKLIRYERKVVDQWLAEQSTDQT